MQVINAIAVSFVADLLAMTAEQCRGASKVRLCCGSVATFSMVGDMQPGRFCGIHYSFQGSTPSRASIGVGDLQQCAASVPRFQSLTAALNEWDVRAQDAPRSTRRRRSKASKSSANIMDGSADNDSERNFTTFATANAISSALVQPDDDLFSSEEEF